MNEPGRSLRRVRSGCDGSWSADRVRVDRDDDVAGGIVSAIPLFLGYFWMLWDKEKQCWHDKIASDVVVKA